MLVFTAIVMLIVTSLYCLAGKSIWSPGLSNLDLPENSNYLNASPWGVAPSHTSAWNINRWKDAIYSAGIKNVRGFRVDQPDIVESLRDTGFELNGILQWSSTKSPGSVPADDLDGWEVYIRETVAKFPYVTHWEVWNEPPNFTHDKTPDSYAAIVARAYDVIKTIDPGLQVGLAAKSTHLNYMAQTIHAGARNKFDYITLHPYEVLDLVKTGYDALYMNIAHGTRKMLQEFNPEKVSVPIRFTEVGTELEDPLNGEDAQAHQAGVLVKAMTMSLAQGIEKVYWFEPMDTEGLTLGLLESQSTPRKALQAFENLVHLIGDYPVYLGWHRPQQGAMQLFFRNKEQVVSISWADSDTSFRLAIGEKGAKVVDLVSGESQAPPGPAVVVGAEPVAVVYPITTTGIVDTVRSALENRRRPLLPYNGGFGEVEMISITPDSENGIRILGDPQIVSAGVERAFDLSRQTSLMAVLSPSFFNTFKEDVEVTLEVRAKPGATATPGFNLKLDSYSTAEVVAGENSSPGWNSISSIEFYRKTWKIYDLTSTGSFGYQLRFESDSSELSQYEVKKLSVRRLQ